MSLRRARLGPECSGRADDANSEQQAHGVSGSDNNNISARYRAVDAAPRLDAASRFR